MATVINSRSSLITDPVRNFRFLVRFEPHDATAKAAMPSGYEMGFVSVSGLAVTTDSIPYREGGYNTTVHQIPGQTSFAPITLQRGVMLNQTANWNWMKKLFMTVQGSTNNTLTSSFRCDLEIQVLTHPIPGSGEGSAAVAANGNNPATPASVSTDDHVSVRFKVYNAWVTSVAYSDLNAGDNAIFVEQMTLVHEGFDAHFATGLEEADTAGVFGDSTGAIAFDAPTDNTNNGTV